MAMNPRLLRPLARVAPTITPTAPPMATMVSTKSTGYIDLYAESDSGYYKVMWWDSTSDVFASGGDINSKAASGAGEKTISIFACDENGAAIGSLTYLYCLNNSLTSLDVSGLTALTYLGCSGNSLTSLDVSGLTALTYLDCYANSLTSLDVSGLTALTSLHCSDNSLTSLDVSGLTALTSLHCSDNSLTSLDVSGLTALTSLTCSGNSLTSIRAVGLSPTGYWNTLFGYYNGGFDLRNNSLSASALNQFYTDLANGSGILVVGGNTGTASDDPTIATAKGYTVYGS